MTSDTEAGRRRGGREARRALRAAPLPANEAPIRPGMPGGQYKPLDEAGVRRVNEAVMTVLETIGLAQAIPSCVEACTRVGAVMGDDGRLRFPRAVVEDTIAKACRRFVMHGQDPRHDMEPWGTRVYFGTAGAAVEIADPKTRSYRHSQLADLYDMARLVDALDNIHFFQRTVVPRDMPTARDMDFNTLYACVSGTTKHVGSSWVNPAYVEKSFEMLHLIAGGERKWRERPFVSQSNCFVVPPLKFAEDACRCLEAAVAGGMPVLLLSAGQAGATAPAALAGAVVQATAEVLAGLVYVNALKPGHPAIFGTWPFVSDLRTGAMSGGSGEQALLSAACAQMAQFYDLVGGAAAGMSDAKLPDPQSGYEKGITLSLAGLSGLNLVYESAGMHASLLGFSLESLVIDNDTIGQVQRCIRGIEVDDDSLSIETMREVCMGGPGHYLGSDQTLRLMQTAYVYPAVGDRTSPKEWLERGKPDILVNADKKMREILSGHYPRHIADEVDAEIRRVIDIKLPRATMSTDGGRWLDT
jgi:trimethylamine--corrinoid protein Co-methyltransferase